MNLLKIKKEDFKKMQEEAKKRAEAAGCGGWWDLPPFLSNDLEEVKEYYKSKNIELILID